MIALPGLHLELMGLFCITKKELLPYCYCNLFHSSIRFFISSSTCTPNWLFLLRAVSSSLINK